MEVPHRINLRRYRPRNIYKPIKIKDHSENIKSNEGKATNNQQVNPIRLSADFSEKLYWPELSGMIYLK